MGRLGRGSASLGCALAALGAAGCAAPDAHRHVLVILVDTLRADHTSLVGEGRGRDTTPRLRALAAEGTVFTRHLANAPWTKPSVASILTGLLPPAHGSQWGDFRRAASGEVDVLAEGFDTLPELLRERGYSTVAFMTNTTLTPALGYAQGFDRYEQLGSNLDGDRAALHGAAEALERARRPTFVWCHLMAPHNYVLPDGRVPRVHSPTRTPIRPRREKFGGRMRRAYGFRFREQAIATYDEVVRWVDEQVSDLVRRVRAEHPQALVVFTSDHGEEFGEHGGYLHARTLHSELLHVPLVIWGPDVPRGGVVTRLTQSVDLLPTVLDALGLDAASNQGRSLLVPAAEDASIYAEKRNGAEAMRAWITNDGKLLETKPPGQPGEKPPISGEGTWRYFVDPVGPDSVDAIESLAPTELARRRALLEETWARSVRLFGERVPDGASRRAIRDDEIEALRALGYVEEESDGGAVDSP